MHREFIIALAARHRLPAIYPFRFFVADGGLISYGPDTIDSFHRAAGYVARILKGEKPSDLPVQQATKYETVLNLKTAKALGLTIPETLLATADEVIQNAGSSSRGSGARRRGRWWRERNRATACGESAYSYRATKTVPFISLASLRSRKCLRTWVGRMGATCVWTFVGPALTPIGYERSRRSWSACTPTSS
jgi:hypothetical protein